jgi:hypothetical protein
MFLLAAFTTLLLAAACGGGDDNGSGNESSRAMDARPDDAAEVATAWSGAAEKLAACIKEAEPKNAEADKLPKDERRAAKRKLELELSEQMTSILAVLAPLSIKSLSPETFEINSVGGVTGVSVVLGLYVKIPVTMTLKKSVDEMIEFRLHGEDGSILANCFQRVDRLGVGEKEVVTISIKWEFTNTTKRAVAYGTARVREPSDSPAVNSPRSDNERSRGNAAPAGNGGAETEPRSDSTEDLLDRLKNDARVAFSVKLEAPKTLTGAPSGGGVGATTLDLESETHTIQDKVYSGTSWGAIVAEPKSGGTWLVIVFSFTTGKSELQRHSTSAAVDAAIKGFEQGGFSPSGD